MQHLLRVPSVCFFGPRPSFIEVKGKEAVRTSNKPRFSFSRNSVQICLIRSDRATWLNEEAKDEEKAERGDDAPIERMHPRFLAITSSKQAMQRDKEHRDEADVMERAPCPIGQAPSCP